MQEQVKGILFDFKNEGWSVQKLEKELGFSNGSLGKAASGKVNLSEVRFIKLLDLHQKTFKKTPTVTEGLKKQIEENSVSPKKEAIEKQRNHKKVFKSERKLMDGFNEKVVKAEMPKGLSIEDRIEWLEKNNL